MRKLKGVYIQKLVARLPKGVNSLSDSELSGNLPGNQPLPDGFQLPEKTNFSNTKPEKLVENYLVARFNANDWWCLKEKVANKRGWPDRTGYPGGGRVYFIECKDRGKDPRPDQADIHRRLKDKGLPVLLIDTKEKVQQPEFHIKFNIPVGPASNLWHPDFKTRKPKNA